MHFLLISAVCAVSAAIIGGLWYSPQVFGKTWAKLADVDLKDKSGAAVRMLYSFLANIALAVTLYSIAEWSQAYGVRSGMVMGILLGFGVVMMSMMLPYMWEKRSPKLFMINASYQVIVIITMSMIITSLA